MAARSIPLAERLAARLVETPGPMSTPCQIWTGSVTRAGYGQIALGRTMIGTHRAAWIVANGDIPDGHHVHHRCGQPLCCAPNHLAAMPATDHLREHGGKVLDACKRGHEFTPENTYETAKGRQCRACTCARQREYHRARVRNNARQSD